MSGLFGTLNVAARALQAQQIGIEVTGNNLANSANPAYARQRANLVESPAETSPYGPLGTGVEVQTIQQLRSGLIDGQIQQENSTSSYWNSQQQALQYAQAAVGQQISSVSTSDPSGQQGIAGALNDLFNSFQSLSTDPTSISQRQVLLAKASDLAGRFNQISQSLDGLHASLDQSLQTSVTNANGLLSDIAKLNNQIVNTENSTTGTANDLRDLRQQKLEELSKLVTVDTAPQANGGVNVSVGGQLLVSDQNVVDTLQTYDAGGGQLLVRTTTGGVALTPTSGSIAGTIDVRDGAVRTLSDSLDTLADQLITQVNAVHTGGFSLTGSTNAKFFTGSDARTIGVNQALLDNPSLVQASGVNGATGDNQVALALAQLANAKNSTLNNQTFSQSLDETISTMGQSLSSANGHVSDENIVQGMLQQQRSSVSGVSLDEEMTNLTIYQRAYQASARVITVADDMLNTLINVMQ